MKAKELAAFFASLPPNSDVKIAAAVDGQFVVDDIVELISLNGGAIIKAVSFRKEAEARMGKKVRPHLEIVQ